MSHVETWAAQLQDNDVAERLAAAEQLCQLGEDASAAAVPLVRATADESAISQCAVAALEGLGAPDASDTKALAELAQSSRELEAYWAVTLLGRLESSAIAAEHVLLAVLGGARHQSVRQRAAWALGRLGTLSEVARAQLAEASQAADPRLARLAAAALRQ